MVKNSKFKNFLKNLIFKAILMVIAWPFLSTLGILFASKLIFNFFQISSIKT